MMSAHLRRTLTLLCIAPPALAASFTPLGSFPGGSLLDQPRDISADGSIIVGVSDTGAGVRAFRWTAGTGMVGIDSPAGAGSSEALGVSVDGGVIVGSAAAPGGTQEIAWRLTAAGGLQVLPALPGYRGAVAMDTSADGSVTGGALLDASLGTSWAATWTSGAEPRLLGTTPESRVEALSADGTVAVGYAQPGGFRAFRWTEATGATYIPELAGTFNYFANDVSGDGVVVVGHGQSRSTFQSLAFRWSSASGTVGLPNLDGGLAGSYAAAISANGSVIVGSVAGAQGEDAVLWTGGDPRRIADLLAAQGAGIPAGWRLTGAGAVSADGLTIAGLGRTGSGQFAAWVATLDSVYVPLPGGFLLMATTLAAGLVHARRRRAR